MKGQGTTEEVTPSGGTEYARVQSQELCLVQYVQLMMGIRGVRSGTLKTYK